MTNCQDQIDGNKDGFLKNQKSLLQNGYNITDMYRNGNIGKMSMYKCVVMKILKTRALRDTMNSLVERR